MCNHFAIVPVTATLQQLLQQSALTSVRGTQVTLACSQSQGDTQAMS